MADTARPPGSSTNSNIGDEKHAQATEEKPQDGPGATPNAGKENVAAAGPASEETKPTLKPDASKGGPGLSKYVPSWVAANVKNPASLKILFRCWLASWAAFILILPTKNLTVLGNAAFFTVLCSFFMPPNLPIQTFLFAMSTMVIGVCLGWAFGAAGMAAALAARSQTLLAAAIQKTEASAATATNPDAVFQVAVFEGVFLDTRSSVVMGVFLGVGTFLFALIRAYKPQFTLMSVFGTIAIDIFCTIGPLFPTGYYTIPEIILLPVAQYMAIAVFLIIFVFPETMSHAYLKTAVSILGIVQTILVLQDEVLSSDPRDIDMESALMMKLRGLREGMVKLYFSLGQRFKLINSEFSYGRWHSTDVQDLEQPLLGIVARINGLMSFVRYIGRKSHFFNEMAATSRDDTSTLHGSSHSHSQGDSYLLRQLYDRSTAAEEKFHVRLSDVLPSIRSATADLREASAGAVGSTKDMLEFINKTRWKGESKKGDEGNEGLARREKELDEWAERLRGALEDFKERRRLELVEPYEGLIESQGQSAPLWRSIRAYSCTPPYEKEKELK